MRSWDDADFATIGETLEKMDTPPGTQNWRLLLAEIWESRFLCNVVTHETWLLQCLVAEDSEHAFFCCAQLEQHRRALRSKLGKVSMPENLVQRMLVTQHLFARRYESRNLSEGH